jgi:protein-S-isoprenylcysteine O-methyltransferase Ste14
MRSQRAVLSTIATVLAVAALLFVPAGRLDWPQAWAVLGFFVVFSMASFGVLHPDLIAERSRLPPDTRLLDLALAVPAAVFLYPVSLVVCGLDARSADSPFPAALSWTAFGVFAVGYAFSLWAAATNPFFSAVVRIQSERGHHVIDRGPYAWVRHPGYAGPMLSHLALPLALGSLRALLPAALGVVFLALRAVYEERRLARELPGYAEYAARVRHRLVPGLF